MKKRARKAAKSIEISGFLALCIYAAIYARKFMQKKIGTENSKVPKKKGVKRWRAATKKRYTKTWKALRMGVCGTFAKGNGGNAGNGIFYIRDLRKKIPALSALLKNSADF